MTSSSSCTRAYASGTAPVPSNVSWPWACNCSQTHGTCGEFSE